MALACGLALTSCEDVPAPYQIMTEGGTPGGSQTQVMPQGDGTAENPYNVAAINEIDPGVGFTTTESYYVRGRISQLKEFGDSYGNYSYYISDDGKTTNQYYIYRGYGLDGAKFTSATDLAVGDTVVVCGKIVNYNNTLEFAQGNKLVYLNGQTSGITPPAPDELGSNLVANGDFETWTDGQPTHWKSASSASNATLSQWQDAHGGKYAVKIEGSDQNKRLAYEELNLKAGTYYVTYYAKSGGECTSSYGRQCRSGYVAVQGGSVGDYVYGDYVSLTESSWTKVDYNFTLDREQTVCLLIMAPKTCGDLYVDDFELRTADGGLGSAYTPDQPTPDQPAGDAEQITVAEFLSKADTQTTYRLVGTVKNIANTEYGNFDLVDATGSIYVYGLLDKEGNARNFAAIGVKEGDTLTLEGKYTLYGDKPEIKNAKYISHVSASGENPGNPDPDTPGVETGDCVTLDVAANCFGIPSDKQTAAGTYTSQGISVTITPSEGFNYYYNTKDRYVILGKEGATVEFNGFDFEVAKIEITGRSGASAQTLQNIYVGNEAVSTQTKGAQETNTYVIKEGYRAAGTHYVLRVESAHNTQITEIKVYKTK